jgi:Flp pilus assembly protein TadD
MPTHALRALDRASEPGTFLSQSLYLRGEALRSLERYQEAIEPLAKAAELAPSNTHVWLALGWCQKRIGRIDMAIDSLEHAREVEPRVALIQYNLACYWSLAGGKGRALDYLARALTLDAKYLDLIGEEPDFDPLRSDPDFQALTGGMIA